MKDQIKRSRVEIIIVILLKIILALLSVYYVLAYWVLPALWTHYEHHPKLESAPKTTFTREGIPGDPLNVGLLGSQDDVIHSMIVAGWLPSDPVTFRTSMRITESALFGKPYTTAPVSNLYVFNRIEDLAFEQPVEGNTRERNHVRFWKSDELGKDGRPFWIGAATFDRSVGVSHLTGKITHHIAPDLDEERDKLIQDLLGHSQLVSQYQVTGVGGDFYGHNGGGDPYYTDGELSVGELTVSGSVNTAPVAKLANPVAVQAKNGLWTVIRWILKKL
jgi:hypothetical protein